MASTSSTLTFKVTRQNPELILPAKPTPHEFKPLSDIDDQEYLRFQIPIIYFYGGNGEGKDPVKVIRDAIAKALVFYYPFAGRLREYGGRKLVVECTGEGVMFIEADADVTLQQFGDALSPPFPNVEELLDHVPGSAGITNCPLLLIQATRLKCGGFIFALRLNHTMADGTGIVQFMLAVSELARGAEAPSVQPVWQRHLLNARQPPQVTFTHHEYDNIPDTKGTLLSIDYLVQRSFFFNSSDIAALRSHLPPDLRRRCTRFEIMAACIWRCRTIAISPRPNEELRFIFAVNTRKLSNPPLPEGYYGNALVTPAAITTAENLIKNPLSYAVELVQKAKSKATEEYVKSVSDLMVIRGGPSIAIVGTWVLSDIRRIGLREVNFGWGEAAYGGPAEAGVHGQGELSYFSAAKNNKGEEGVLLLISLPSNAMEVFAKEVEIMMLIENNKLQL